MSTDSRASIMSDSSSTLAAVNEGGSTSEAGSNVLGFALPQEAATLAAVDGRPLYYGLLWSPRCMVPAAQMHALDVLLT